MASSRRKKWDAFISYASEDREQVVESLAAWLEKFGLKVWYDQFSLSAGDSLSESIAEGLSKSAYGILVISKNFVRKNWTRHELQGLTQVELSQNRKHILPIWYMISADEVRDFNPSLADKLAIEADNSSIADVAFEIFKVVKPRSAKNYIRMQVSESLKGGLSDVYVQALEAPQNRKDVPAAFVNRVRIVNFIFNEFMPETLQDSINSFLYDASPESELQLWELMAAVYLKIYESLETTTENRREIFTVLLELSSGKTASSICTEYPDINPQIVESIKNIWDKYGTGIASVKPQSIKFDGTKDAG